MAQPQFDPITGPGTISSDKQWKYTLKGWIPNTISTGPISVKKETPAETLPPLGPPTPAPQAQEQGLPGQGDLGNLRLALRSALSEAAQQMTASRMKALSGFVEGGAAPNVIKAAIGLAQGGLAQKSESIFTGAVEGYTETLKFFQDKQEFALDFLARYPDSGILPTDSPETAARKASRSPSFLRTQRTAGGGGTVADRETAEARASETELENKRGQDGFVDITEYRRMRARSLLNPAEFDRRFTYFLNEGDQSRIKAESASPSTKTPEDFSRGEQIIQANVDYISEARNQNQEISTLFSLIQRETNLTDSEITKLLERFGIRRFGSTWTYQRP